MNLTRIIKHICDDQIFDAYDWLQGHLSKIPLGIVCRAPDVGKYRMLYFVHIRESYQLFVCVMIGPRNRLTEFVFLVDQRPRIVADKIMLATASYYDEHCLVGLNAAHDAIFEDKVDPITACTVAMELYLHRIATEQPEEYFTALRTSYLMHATQSIGALRGGLPSLGKRR